LNDTFSLSKGIGGVKDFFDMDLPYNLDELLKCKGLCEIM